ncbi:MAG: regulatory iron-sulfur-containing complex subunit RicT [Candidatus Gracilibacteria bacterium]|jgi:cell fate regulator YaaT (PSP1 superfamily)
MAKNVTGINCSFTGSVVEIPYHENDSFKSGDSVIFRDEDGKEEFGTVKFVNVESFSPEKVLEDSKILRPATPHDFQKMESHEEQSRTALDACRDLVLKHSLDMQIFNSGISFDGTKIHFMFTAEERVDFREMVKDLAKIVKKQIYLKQVGARDKAKHVGGFGKCGRTLCCSTFLGRLESVSMDMVRDQGLESKGSSKLSGSCGKLLCCLRYEIDTYRQLREGIPDVGSIVKFKKSVVSVGREGQVSAIDVLNQKLRVFSSEKELLVINVSDVEKVLKSPDLRPGRAGRRQDAALAPEPTNEEENIEVV